MSLRGRQEKSHTREQQTPMNPNGNVTGDEFETLVDYPTLKM
jgi:hypothetical protein